MIGKYVLISFFWNSDIPSSHNDFWSLDLEAKINPFAEHANFRKFLSQLSYFVIEFAQERALIRLQIIMLGGGG